MPRAIAAMFALLIVAFGGVYATQAALEGAGDNIFVENETWTPSAGSVTVLDDSEQTGAYYDTNVTVRDENDTVVDVGTDYEWFSGNGTVKALSGGELDGDANASITYGYSQTTGEQRAFAGLLGDLSAYVGLVAPAFLGVLIIGLLRRG